MALQSLFPPIDLQLNSPGSIPQQVSLASAGNKRAVILKVPQTGTLTGFDFSSGASVTSSGDVDGRAETVDASSLPSVPSGTLVAAGANGTVTINAANTIFSVTFTTPLSVTAGQEIALVIVNTTGNYNILGMAGVQSYGYPYALNNTTGSYVVSNSPVFALNYGGVYVPTVGLWLPTAAVSVGTTSTPDEIGNLFSFPVAVNLVSVQAVADFDGACDLILYDANDNVLRTVSVVVNTRAANSAGGFYIPFSSSYLTTPNANYRIVFKPSTTTTLAMRYWLCGSSARRAAASGGSAFQYTSRTDAGSWTEDNTRQALIYPRWDGVDNGISLNRAFGAV